MSGTVVEAHVLAAIDATATPYERIACDPRFADTAEFCERYGFSLGESANTIVIASKRPKGRHCACLVLATTRLDVNRRVCGLLDVKKASFASADETAELTGMTVGGVTPFGLPSSMPVYVDARIERLSSVIVGGGSRSMKLRIDPESLRRLGNVEFVDGLAHEAP